MCMLDKHCMYAWRVCINKEKENAVIVEIISEMHHHLIGIDSLQSRGSLLAHSTQLQVMIADTDD